MTDDPTNPKHYAGRACADLGERLSANGYQILKYVWRCGKKDAAVVELGKALWYADSERSLLIMLNPIYNDRHQKPLVADLDDSEEFLAERIAGQSDFVAEIATMLWRGYNLRKLQNIIELVTAERQRHVASN